MGVGCMVGVRDLKLGWSLCMLATQFMPQLASQPQLGPFGGLQGLALALSLAQLLVMCQDSH